MNKCESSGPPTVWYLQPLSPSAVNTKAEVRFHVDSADWLPQRVKDRLRTMVGGAGLKINHVQWYVVKGKYRCMVY